jgi:hypothetical protein
MSSLYPFAALKPATFPPTSRYVAIGTRTFTSADGTQITYLERRFLPPSNTLALLTRHSVQNGDRLDNIAAEYMNDPLQFWQICDANDAVNPDDLTSVLGVFLRITFPAGVPGSNQ